MDRKVIIMTQLISVAHTAQDTMNNSALMQNMWLAGAIPDPKDNRMEPLIFDFEVPIRAERMYRSEMARKKRRGNKVIIQAKAKRLGKQFLDLSDAGESARAKRVMRMRDELPHVRVRAN